MQKPLILLGTQGCHLCEQAEHLLQSKQWPYEYVDIIDHENLLTDYGQHIPVLLLGGLESDKKLFWPFNAEQLAAWYNS